MAEEYNQFDILQNPALGAIAIYEFINGFETACKEIAQKEKQPSIYQIFYILPIIYDPKLLASIKAKLYTSILDNKELTIGLQDKANKMSPQTFDSLNIGFSKKVFILNNENFTVSNNKYFKNEISKKIRQNNVKFLSEIIVQSRRLGKIFALTDEKTLQNDLNIKF